MSEIRNILTMVTDGPRSLTVLALAARLAKSHGASLRALHAVEPLNSGAYMTPEAAGLAMQWAAEEEEKRRKLAAARVGEAASAAGLDIALAYTEGSPVDAALLHGCTADLIVLGQRDPNHGDGTAAGFAERLLVGAGCPLLFVPYVDTMPLLEDRAPPLGSHALVAWTPKRESARALRDAMPLLRSARMVELMRFLQHNEADDGLAEAAVRWLASHGIAARARVERLSAPSFQERMLHAGSVDVPIADAVLSYAADVEADLVVMGGYGHPRAWELAMGGVTRTMLQSMTVPVVMSH
jgi:nucleotide-binding universal stress UspA family protein